MTLQKPGDPKPLQVVVVSRPVNHILHLLLSIVTLGLWIPVWVILSLTNRARLDKQLPPIDLNATLMRAGIAIAVIVVILIVGSQIG